MTETNSKTSVLIWRREPRTLLLSDQKSKITRSRVGLCTIQARRVIFAVGEKKFDRRKGREREREIYLNYVGRASYIHRDDLCFASYAGKKSKDLLSSGSRARAARTMVAWVSKLVSQRTKHARCTDGGRIVLLHCVRESRRHSRRSVGVRRFARGHIATRRNGSVESAYGKVLRAPTARVWCPTFARLRVYTVDPSRVKWMDSFPTVSVPERARHLFQPSHLSRAVQYRGDLGSRFQRDFTLRNLESA